LKSVYLTLETNVLKFTHTVTITVIARLLGYDLQAFTWAESSYTANINFLLPLIAGPQNCGSGAAAPPARHLMCTAC